ncbi:hypothetical protein ABT404_49730, partial [Streptomyces hyaluromycini]
RGVGTLTGAGRVPLRPPVPPCGTPARSYDVPRKGRGELRDQPPRTRAPERTVTTPPEPNRFPRRIHGQGFRCDPIKIE